MRPIFALAALLLLAAPPAHAQDVHTYNSGLPNDAHQVLRGHRSADRPIDAVAFTPQNEWIIVSRDRVDASPGFPATAARKVRDYVASGRRVDAIAFDPAGRYVIVAEDWRWYSHATYLGNAGLRSTVDHYVTNGRRVDSISFDPDGDGWVVVADGELRSRRVSTPWFNRTSAAYQAGLLPMHGVWLSPDDGFVAAADDHLHAHGVPTGLDAQLRRFRADGRRVDQVVFTATGGWSVVSNGVGGPRRFDTAGFIEYALPRVEGGTTNIWDRLDELNLPGAAVAFIDRGEVQWVRGYGVQTAGTQDFVTAHTMFQAASISKTVAAVTAMQLVDDGALDLGWDLFGDDLGNLPDDGHVAPWVEGHRGSLRLRASANRWRASYGLPLLKTDLRVGELMTHTGGLTPSGYGGYAAGAALPSLDGILAGVGLSNTAAGYSGGGLMVLQGVIEDLTGQPFEQYAWSRVMVPTGMIYSGFEVGLRAAWLREFAAAGHDATGAVIAPSPGLAYPQAAAAGLTTNAAELARFVAHMIAISRTNAPRQDGVLRPATARQTTMQRNASSYGRGFRVYDSDGDLMTTGDRHFQHGGTNAGIRAHFVGLPDAGRGLVVLTNGELGKVLANDVAQATRRYFGWPQLRTSVVNSTDCPNFQAGAANRGFANAPCTYAAARAVGY